MATRPPRPTAPGATRRAAPGLSPAATVLTARPARAAPQRHLIDAAASRVDLEADDEREIISATTPVADAGIVLDCARPAAGRFRMALDVRGSRVPFPSVAEAIKGRSVLDAARFPSTLFESAAVRVEGTRARLEVWLTIRKVTRPMALDADVFRPRSTAPGGLSALSVHIRRRVIRSDHGATGFSDLAGDEVRIRIIAPIRRAS
jgi:polyisoprenoid-binding protein YceI